MGYSFYDIASLPRQYDIVWCLYPRWQDKLRPGPVARPTLVLDVRVNVEEKRAGLIVAYGTGEFDENQGNVDLIIDNWHEVRALGLHKPTRFALSLESRMMLPWCAEYFVPPYHVREAGVIAGSLHGGQIDRLLECLAARGLRPYV